MKGPFKLAPDSDLFCDFDNPQSEVLFTTLPSVEDPHALAFFDMSGPVVCFEVPAGTEDPNPSDALPPGRGLFQLTQATVLEEIPAAGEGPFDVPRSGDFVPGFKFAQFCEDGAEPVPIPPDGDPTTCDNLVRRWTFDASDPNLMDDETGVLYELVALDDVAKQFCDDETAGDTECKLYFGLERPPVSDTALGLGEIIRFETRTLGASDETPLPDVLWTPCHNQSFTEVHTFVVDAHLNSSTDDTPDDGFEAGPVNTGMYFNEGDPLIVSVHPGSPHLWNAGVDRETGVNDCDPFCRWSNADGLVRNLFASDEDGSAAISGEPPGTLIGVDWLRETGGQHTQGDLTAPFGALVGEIDGHLFMLGTDFNGVAPASGELKLFYFDANNQDNEGTVTVQVLDEPPILCEAEVDGDSVPAGAVSDIRSERQVRVEVVPTVNVSNKSPQAVLPVVVLGCNTPPFAITFTDGNFPTPEDVFVNGEQVQLKSFRVKDVISDPICDGGEAIADLELKINRLGFIGAVTPCENGENAVSLSVGNDEEGFLGGEDMVKLTNCKKKK